MTHTLPTAESTIRSRSKGTQRSRSRKKATVKRKNARKMSDNHAEINHVAIAAKAKIRRIQRASKRVCARITGSIFRVQNPMVKQREKGLRNQSSRQLSANTIS